MRKINMKPRLEGKTLLNIPYLTLHWTRLPWLREHEKETIFWPQNISALSKFGVLFLKSEKLILDEYFNNMK